MKVCALGMCDTAYDIAFCPIAISAIEMSGIELCVV